MKAFSTDNIVVRKLQKLPDNVSQVIQTAVLGLSAGLSAVLFLFMTNTLFDLTYVRFAARSKTFFALASLATIVSTSLLVGFLLNKLSPDAAGSGIPEVKSAYWKELGYLPFRTTLIKFVAGTLSIGGGASLGREGPSVYIGAGVASNLAGLMGSPRRGRRAPTLMGSSAGLAAAFNTPMAAITFAIEEILGDLNSRYLGRVVLASVLGAFAVFAILGRQPAFALPAIEKISWLHYAVVPLVAAIASLAGVAFQKATLLLRAWSRRLSAVPAWVRPALGGLVTWALGVTLFLAAGRIGVFGLGYNDLSRALNNDFPWQIAGLMVLAKLAATIASYGFGGCGGIFAPSLFIGGMTGYFLGGLAGIWMPLTPADHIVLSAVGMSACLGTIVGAPLTSLLIVFEMTHQFALVPALMIGLIISRTVSRLSGRLNFYDAVLVQDGHELHKIHPPLDLQSWQGLEVSAIANPRPVVVRSLDLASLQGVVYKYPYNYFPVELEGRLAGVLTRQQILEALPRQDAPEIRNAATCFPDQTVREVGDKFIQSPVNVLIVVGRESGDIRGIITLHDLIRAQASVSS
ncbi:MAG: chloride channel protein [Candidatus Aminicenantes bacterium]|nr:chloride channel protein [Candidatus Aminicenantes bacterium]